MKLPRDSNIPKVMWTRPSSLSDIQAIVNKRASALFLSLASNQETNLGAFMKL